MVPAQLVAFTVPMLADALPQFLDFRYEFATRHLFEIIVHRSLLIFIAVV